MPHAWKLLGSSIILLTGCSVTRIATREPASNPNPGPALSGTTLKGMVHGGQQPIEGASVYMFALKAQSYGVPSESLLSNTGNTDGSSRSFVTTNSTGGFTITSDEYTCGGTVAQPTPQQVYLYAVGGNAGFDPNSAAGLMAVLGQCTANAFTGLPSSIQMDEVTTVAAAYALAGYATDAADMSGSTTALAATGMANAALSAANLVNLGTGQALTSTPAGNGTVPQSEINTLADILASCINTSGSTSSACTTLFGNATADGTPTGKKPAETATAAINIAHHPGANVGTLFGLSSPSAPFQPSLGSAPNDWTIAVSYTGGGLDLPITVAIDGSGNVWLSNYSNSSLSEFNSSGAPFSLSPYTGGGIVQPFGLAIDASGDAWVTDDSGNSVTEFSPGGTPSGPYTGGGLANPYPIAIDASGNVWAANTSGASISELTSSGNGFLLSPYSGGGLSSPHGIAIDTLGNVWTANYGGNNSISEFDSSGNPISPDPQGDNGGGLDGPIALAIDNSGNIWVANDTGSSISEFNSSGSPVSATAYTGGGLNQPIGIAIDGAGNVWTSNYAGNSLSEFNSGGVAISPSTGYQAGLFEPYGVAIDGSGNVWTGNAGGSGTTLTEFVGAATPVVTPLAVGVANSELGTPP